MLSALLACCTRTSIVILCAVVFFGGIINIALLAISMLELLYDSFWILIFVVLSCLIMLSCYMCARYLNQQCNLLNKYKKIADESVMLLS